MEVESTDGDKWNERYRQHLKIWAREAPAKANTFESWARRPIVTNKAKKGEDRGKPSLRRTIREDVPDAHRAKTQVERDGGEAQTKNKKLNLRMKAGVETAPLVLGF